ncbi:MAG: hypothetical protein JXQ99_08500 [Hyphomicrobiaceae bacterium]
MTALSEPKSIADLTPQHAQNPATEAEARAHYFNTGNVLNVVLPEVPNAVFADEPRRALDPATETDFIGCDVSLSMECAFPAHEEATCSRPPDLQLRDACLAVIEPDR